MKRSFTCFGVLSVLAIIFGLSLNVSLDTSALSYDIDNFMIADDTINFYKIHYTFTNSDVFIHHNRSNNFYISFPNSNNNVAIPDGFEFPHTWRFYGSYDPEFNSCYLPQFSNSYTDGVFTSSGNYDYSYSLYSPVGFSYDYLNLFKQDTSPFDINNLFNSSTSSIYSPDMLCHVLYYSYYEKGQFNPPANGNMPTWDWSSLINIPLVNNRFSYEKSKPSYYAFDRIYINGTKESDGLISNSRGISMSNIFKVPVPTFNKLIMNFQLFNGVTSSNKYDDHPEYSGIRKFDFVGSIEFETDYNIYGDIIMDWSNDYNPNFSTENLTYEIINNNRVYDLPSGFSGHKNCDLTEYHKSNGDDFDRLDFVCSYDPLVDGGFTDLIDFDLFTTSLGFIDSDPSNPASTQPFLFTRGDYVFKDFRIITNGNDSPSGWSATSRGFGGDYDGAPGQAGDSVYEPNFLESLKTMFDFNFLNPFTPILNLFTDQNQCAQIPIISRMLHSDEIQVCPWFPESVRNITTPVLGMFSMMLVFGFAVHWLGARSGNLFEDSVQTDDYKFTSRVGRSKKK